VSRLGLDLLASKVRRPPVRPGTVPRPFLIEQLRGGDRWPIVSVVAPPG
jgi:ATP/maltotriose-dependent transcriptional regulator MalT